MAIEGPPLKVPLNATCEVQEPEDEEANEYYVKGEEVDEEMEEPGGSTVHFLTTEGVDDDDDYDEVVADMNSESYVVMT